VLAEVFSGSLIDMTQIVEQKLLVPLALPETTAYPAAMKSAIRIATDRLYYGLGWNTNWGNGAKRRPASKICRALIGTREI